MKYLAETTGNFELYDQHGNGQIVAGDRPSVIENSSFVNQRVALEQIKYLGEVNDEATDEEFAKYWKESNNDSALAIDSFLASFGVEKASTKGKQKLDLDDMTDENENEPKGKGKGKIKSNPEPTEPVEPIKE